MGGAAKQQASANGGSSAAGISFGARLPRCTIQTWSSESTETPMVEPSSQLLGSGFGQNGSTSNSGAFGIIPWASTSPLSIPPHTRTAASRVPMLKTISRDFMSVAPQLPDSRLTLYAPLNPGASPFAGVFLRPSGQTGAQQCGQATVHLLLGTACLRISVQLSAKHDRTISECCTSSARSMSPFATSWSSDCSSVPSSDRPSASSPSS